MEIKVNGEILEVADNITLTKLIDQLGLKAETTVAELEKEIIEQENYATTILTDQVSLELIRFVGGG